MLLNLLITLKLIQVPKGLELSYELCVTPMLSITPLTSSNHIQYHCIRLILLKIGLLKILIIKCVQ